MTSNTPINVEDATVVVEPIKIKADANVKTEKYVGLLTYKDEVAPKIVSVEAKTSEKVAKEITVKVSEPVKTGALAKVNGTYASVDFNGTDKATITGLSLEAGKTHTLELINFEDLAGNKTVSETVNFTVAVDAVAPVATVSAKGDKAILVTFDKSMDEATVIAALATGSVKDEALADVATGTVTVVPNTDSKQFVIPVTKSNIFANKDSRTFNVVFKDTIKDTLGNKMVATTQTVTLTKDEVKPVATGYNVVKDADGKVTAIEFTFSKELAAASNIAFGSVVDENGVLDNTTFAGITGIITANDNKKVVYAVNPAKEINGKFAISFGKDLVSDLAETPNKSDAFSYTIDFGEGKTETEFKITTAPTATGNVITVTFPEAVKGGAVAGSATDLANYTLAGKPLPAGTTIVFTNSTQKVAKITLPEESIEKDDQAAIFTISNVKNTAGTKTVKSYTGTVSVNDNIKPVLESAKILDNKTIELTYSEAMQVVNNGQVGSDFIIKQGEEELTLNASELTAEVVSGFDKKVKITIAQGTDSEGTPAKPATAVASGTNASKVEISYGNKATQDATLTYTVAKRSAEDTTLVVKKDGVEVENSALDESGNGSFTVDNVTVTIKGAVENDEFTITTTAPVAEVPGTSATVLDLTKDITVETKDSSVVVDKAGTPNGQKAEVKVTVAK